MPLFKKILLYFPTLLGVSMVLAMPVGFIFTKAQYTDGGLELLGNTMEYFFSGTKLSYMVFMLPLGLLLELPLFLTIAFPLIIIILKIKFGTFDDDQIVAGISGLIFAIIVFFMKKRGYFNWFNKKNNSIPNPIVNFSIFAYVMLLTIFLAYYFAEYILVYLNNDFKNVGGSFIFPPEFVKFMLGLPIAYAFFTGLLFTLLGKGKVWYKYLFVLPALIFPFLLEDIILTFWTLIFFIVGILIVKFINKILILYRRRKIASKPKIPCT